MESCNFLGWSNIGFDDEMIRKEFLKELDTLILQTPPQTKDMMDLILLGQHMQ